MKQISLCFAGMFFPAVAAGDIPEQIGGYRIGDLTADSYAEAEFEGFPGYLDIVTDLAGHVTHLVFYHDDADALETLISTFSTKSGAPIALSESEWDQSFLWPSADMERTLTLTTAEPCCGGDLQAVAVLETTSPDRLCGQEDGFSAWFKRLQLALKAEDYASVSAAFSYPFVRWELVHDQGDHIDQSHRIDFQTQEEFQSAVLSNSGLQAIFEALETVDADSLACSVIAPEGARAGYSIYVSGIGGLSFERTVKGWRVDQTYYIP